MSPEMEKKYNVIGMKYDKAYIFPNMVIGSEKGLLEIRRWKSQVGRCDLQW